MNIYLDYINTDLIIFQIKKQISPKFLSTVLVGINNFASSMGSF